MKVIHLFAMALIASSATTLANAQGITVSSPANGAHVGMQFVLSAVASPCWSQPIAAMGYSIDYGETTAVFDQWINTPVWATSGYHVLHVKSWGNQGAGCVYDVPITVYPSASEGLSTDLTVTQPSSGSKVVSPFALKAWNRMCQSQPVAAMGYSVDESSNTSFAYGTSMNMQAVSPLGVHTIHVKSWGNRGASCVSDIAVEVVPSPESSLPWHAVAVHSIQTLTNWLAESDAGAGTAGGYGTWGVTNLSGRSRYFAMNYSNYGGERYYAAFGADTEATNFLYDAWVYLPSPSTNIGLLELDMNQVMSNGETVIYGFQCDSWSKTWDYTANAGTPQNFSDVWYHSNAACDIRQWETNTWHHVQISYSRDWAGQVTYKSVWLDNVEQDLYVTVPSSFALGWSPTLLTNFQIDGMTDAPGTATAYVDNLTVYRW